MTEAAIYSDRSCTNGMPYYTCMITGVWVRITGVAGGDRMRCGTVLISCCLSGGTIY
jgi:hypothetical protein